MNPLILSEAVQKFLREHENADPRKMAFKVSGFDGISPSEIAQQLTSRQKAKGKLATWYDASNIYYPKTLNLEQTSSEVTADYKAQLVSGDILVDITGGFGVDSYYFAKKMGRVIHCERDSELSRIAENNALALGVKNTNCIHIDGIEYIKKATDRIDWIYVDPSRRDDKKGKVFLLEDCQPNVVTHLGSWFEKSNHVLVKTAPLLDLKQGMQQLEGVREIHMVAVKNEVKELLWVLEKGFKSDPDLVAVNITPNKIINPIRIPCNDESEALATYSQPQGYLYEPHAALMKTGAFHWIATKFNLYKLAKHSHLYTSNALIDFPGRRFLIRQSFEYGKREMKSRGYTKANVSARNFPLNVAALRKKHRIKDGGETYPFFTQVQNDKKWVLECKKV